MKKDTKQKLIKAGVQAMLEKSYHAVGIKEILDKVGVPKGSFYYYFKSKEDFGIEIINFFAEKHANDLKFLLNSRTGTPIARLKNCFESCLEYYSKNEITGGCLVAKLSHEVCNISPGMRVSLKNAFDRWQALYAKIIREGQRLGEINSEHDADQLAEFLQNAWEGAIMKMLVSKDVQAVKIFLSLMFDTILKKPAYSTRDIS